MSASARLALDWVEQGLVPDSVIRAGIRRLCTSRLQEIAHDDPERSARLTEDFVAAMDAAPVALVPDKANAQHYEVPASFFDLALGPRRKYSACFWPEGIDDLAAAEETALETTAERAGLADGMRILELGCGWGSLTLWMAARFARARITAVSNSHSQRAAILLEAQRLGLANVEVITADMNAFDTEARFERVVSVEMFEHMRNWRALFGRIHRWLVPGGRFFMHVFCHRATPYAFTDHDALDWMSRYFFTGGMMPTDDLPLRFQDDLRLAARWRWSGQHYQRTANAWLANLDARSEQALPVLAATYGSAGATQWLQRWRIFFMACAELFGYDGGRQWWVSHYLFERSEQRG